MYYPRKIYPQLVKHLKLPEATTYEVLKKEIAVTSQSKYYFNNDDSHFNERGNALFAKAHLEFLLDPKNELLPL